MTVTISRLYNNYDDARAAIRNLEAAGVRSNDISVVASNADNWYSDDRKASTYPDRDLDGRDDRAEAAGAGAGVGATVGGVAGLLAGLGMMAIPGIGPVVAAGWLVSTFAGAAAGVSLEMWWAHSRRPVSTKKMPIPMPKDCAAAAPS
jgi:hypothetical protein